MALGSKPKDSFVDKFENTSLEKKGEPEENLENTTDSKRRKIKYMSESIVIKISKEDKKILQRYCEKNGTTISNKVRELIYKYMNTQNSK